jgi:hypothetical protein
MSLYATTSMSPAMALAEGTFAEMTYVLQWIFDELLIAIFFMHLYSLENDVFHAQVLLFSDDGGQICILGQPKKLGACNSGRLRILLFPPLRPPSSFS